MTKNGKCPQCKSAKIKMIDDNGVSFIQCLQCGYDELEDDDTFPETRTSQKAKGQYSPYKTGGSKRTQKR